MAKMMTNADFFMAVANANLSAEITEKALHLYEVNANKSAKRDGAKSALASANLELANKVAEVMSKGVTYAVSELAPHFSDLSTSKLSAVMRVGVDAGLFSVTEGYKVNGKGRGVKGYSLV